MDRRRLKEEEEIEALAHLLAAEEDDEPFDPGKKEGVAEPKIWMPRLNQPNQQALFDDPADLIIAYGPKFTGKCCPLETCVVYTRTGMKRLRAMKPSISPGPDGFSPIDQPVVSFDGERLVNARATHFYTEPNRQSITLDLANGAELAGSPRHPVWCCYPDAGGRGTFGYLSLHELMRRVSIGERIWTPLMPHPSFGGGSNVTVAGVEIDVEMGYLLGALAGDGSLNAAEDCNRQLHFTNSDSECVTRVRATLERLGARLRQDKHRPYQYGIPGGRLLKELVVALDMNHGAYFKRIPDAIVESPRPVVAAFLRGLFDTDGTVCKNTGGVQLCTTSRLMALDVQAVMAAFGINAVRRPKKSVSSKPTWTLYITGEWAEIFADEIGFSITRKQQLIARRQPSQMSPHGNKRHHYGYPVYISKELKRIASAGNPGIRTPRGPVRLHQRGSVWSRRLGGPLWAPELTTVVAYSAESAAILENELSARRDAYYQKHLRTREWHRSTKHLRSWGSVPVRPKLDEFIKIYGGADELRGYMISDTWLEIKGARWTEHDLADLTVAETHSFVAGGFVNHNTVGMGHKIIRHCWQEFDAMFMVIGVSAESLGQGICHDLQTLAAPTWKDGNRHPMYLQGADGRMLLDARGNPIPNPQAGELMDSGLGIEFSRWKIDPVSKRMWMWVQNRFGGKSCIRVASIPYPDMIEDRITGPAPSGIMLEEATKCRGRQYYTFPSLQLYRRRGIIGPQQFLMACNPEDPDHWVYELGWVECERAADQPHRAWPDDPVKPGILRDPGVSVYFHSYEENAHNVSQKNREIVERGLRTDPIQRQRLIEGKWVAYPSGEALFKEQFNEVQHIRGDRAKSIGLEPVPGYPIILGYDVGSVNTAVSFKQYIQTEDGEVEIVFDEFCFYRTRTKIRRVAHALLEKMRYWTIWLWDRQGYDPDNPPRDADGEPLPFPYWSFWHIAGDDALTMHNPSKGSTYAKDLNDDSQALIEERPERYFMLQPIMIRGCPKPPESIKRRVDFTAEALSEGRKFISALCPWHRQMYLHLERAEDDEIPKPEQKYGHTFDADSYPRLYRHLKLPGGFYLLDDSPLVEIST